MITCKNGNANQIPYVQTVILMTQIFTVLSPCNIYVSSIGTLFRDAFGALTLCAFGRTSLKQLHQCAWVYVGYGS